MATLTEEQKKKLRNNIGQEVNLDTQGTFRAGMKQEVPTKGVGPVASLRGAMKNSGVALLGAYKNEDVSSPDVMVGRDILGRPVYNPAAKVAAGKIDLGARKNSVGGGPSGQGNPTALNFGGGNSGPNISGLKDAEAGATNTPRTLGNKGRTLLTNISRDEAGKDFGPVAKDAQGNSLGFARRDLDGGVKFTGINGEQRNSTDAYFQDRIAQSKHNQQISLLKRQIQDKKGGLAKAEGQDYSFGKRSGGSDLARFARARRERNDNIRQEKQSLELNKERINAASRVQKAIADNASKTTTLSEGQTLFDARGRRVASGGPKVSEQKNLLDDVAAQFIKKNDDGSIAYGDDGKPAVNTALQGQFTQYLGKFTSGDQRRDFGDFQMAVQKAVPANHLEALKKDSSLSGAFLKKYGYLPSFARQMT